VWVAATVNNRGVFFIYLPGGAFSVISFRFSTGYNFATVCQITETK